MSIGRVPGSTGIQPTIVDAKGDLIVATANDSVARQAVGTNNQVLTADSAQTNGVKWANGSAATLTTTGDILYASSANTLARLGIGSTSQVLTVSGGVPSWATTGSYSAWTPTWTNVTVGNGTQTARYTQIGKFVHLELKLEFGSTTSVSGNISVNLPVEAKTGANIQRGIAFFTDPGNAAYMGVMNGASTTSNAIQVNYAGGTYDSANNVNATVPFTFGTGDVIWMTATYEAL